MWADSGGVVESGDDDYSIDVEGDCLINQLEFVFGLDAKVHDSEDLVFNGTTLERRGVPTLHMDTSNGTFSALFLLRTDHIEAGLTYTVQFCSNL